MTLWNRFKPWSACPQSRSHRIGRSRSLRLVIILGEMLAKQREDVSNSIGTYYGALTNTNWKLMKELKSSKECKGCYVKFTKLLKRSHMKDLKHIVILASLGPHGEKV